MFKVIVPSLLLAWSTWAGGTHQFFSETFAKVASSTVEVHNLIDWKVGDTNTYNLDMGFIKGSMVQKVREITSEGLWMDQDLDLGFAGKQTASQLIDPATGEIKRFIVNGKEEKVPEPGEQEILEATESSINVPAGQFECIYVKIKDKKSGDVTEAWINPEKVSLGGALKIVQPSQFGKITITLKSYIKR